MKRNTLKDYRNLVFTLIALLSITGIGFIDSAIWNIIFAIIISISYVIVGIMYSMGIISGKKAGRDANAAVCIILIIIGIVIYFGIRRFQQWILTWPLFVKILVPVALGLLIIITTIVIIIIKLKDENNE